MNHAKNERHNEMARKALFGIVRPIADEGGGTSEIMVVLESAVAGVVLSMRSQASKTPAVTDGMPMGPEEGARNRIAKIRDKGK